MDETIINLPHGYRFNPFEEELINFYLKPKVLGQKLSCDVVKERQLYGPDANPWQVFHPENHSWILSEVTPGKFEKVTYVFVNLTKKAAVDKKKKGGRDNYMKKAGCGTWDGQTKRMEIKDSNGNVIGEKRFLVFEINDASDQDLDLSKVGYWKMHEYHLCGDVNNPNNTVLCKITLDYSKNPPVKLRSKTNNDHPVKGASKSQKKGTNVDSVNSCSNQEPITTTQTPGDNVLVSDNYRDKGKEGNSSTEIVEICDKVDCVDNNDIEEDTPVLPSSPQEQPEPVSSDFCWPAIKKEGEKRDLHSGVWPTNPGKRKFNVETSCAMTKKLKPVSSDFPEHDDANQNVIKEAGGREELISNFINFL